MPSQVRILLSPPFSLESRCLQKGSVNQGERVMNRSDCIFILVFKSFGFGWARIETKASRMCCEKVDGRILGQGGSSSIG
jgi:hypothetical protein